MSDSTPSRPVPPYIEGAPVPRPIPTYVDGTPAYGPGAAQSTADPEPGGCVECTAAGNAALEGGAMLQGVIGDGTGSDRKRKPTTKES